MLLPRLSCLCRPGWLWLLLLALDALLLLRSPLRLMTANHSSTLPIVPIQSQSQCQPVNKVVFVKTHKCASTTVQGILLRRALSNSLNLVAPSKGNYVGMNRSFSRLFLKGTPWEMAGLEYHLYCLHTVFNHTEVSSVMGGNRNTTGGNRVVYFSILRDPVDLFVSLWDYYKFGRMYKISLEEYAFANKSCAPNYSQLMHRDRTKRSHVGRNQMLCDMGLPPCLFDNVTAVKDKIEENRQQFNLVLIAERFEESMVLLKDMLCWETSAMTYLKMNSRLSKAKSTISDEARQQLREWLSADDTLYKYFFAEFQRKVDEFGRDRLEREVEELRAANEQFKEACNFEIVDTRMLSKAFRPWGEGIEGYRVGEGRDRACQLHAMSEHVLINKVRREQGHRARKVLREKARQDIEKGERRRPKKLKR